MKDIKDYLKVDPTSPSGLRWIKKASPKAMPGFVAGNRDKNGYWRVKLHGKRYQTSHIVLELSGQAQPEDMVADHRNRDTDNNRLENLRWVTRSVNQYNRTSQTQTKYSFVHKNKNCTTYRYRWQRPNPVSASGFATAEEAYAAALAKRRELGLPINTRLSTVH